jgi:hypothetical protein
MWNVNWLEIIGAALVGFAIGGVWYGPVFGKAWQRLSGLSDEVVQNANMAVIFGGTFVLNLLASLMLAHMFSAAGNPGLRISTQMGCGIGFFFVATSIGVNYLFSRKPLKLFFIDAGYWVVAYAAMGLVFGLS